MIIAIKVFDWTTKRVLCHIRKDGQDRIEWMDMADFYVNPMEAA